MINQADIMLIRQGELSRRLAGCAAMNPAEVLPMLSRLNQEDITNREARRFLAELQARMDARHYEPDELGDLVTQVAVDLGLHCELCTWVSMAIDPDPMISDPGGYAPDLADATIKEIQGLVISRKVIEKLGSYAKEVEARSRWGVYARDA